MYTKRQKIRRDLEIIRSLACATSSKHSTRRRWRGRCKNYNLHMRSMNVKMLARYPPAHYDKIHPRQLWAYHYILLLQNTCYTLRLRYMSRWLICISELMIDSIYMVWLINAAVSDPLHDSRVPSKKISAGPSLINCRYGRMPLSSLGMKQIWSAHDRPTVQNDVQYSDRLAFVWLSLVSTN